MPLHVPHICAAAVLAIAGHTGTDGHARERGWGCGGHDTMGWQREISLCSIPLSFLSPLPLNYGWGPMVMRVAAAVQLFWLAAGPVLPKIGGALHSWSTWGILLGINAWSAPFAPHTCTLPVILAAIGAPLLAGISDTKRIVP